MKVCIIANDGSGLIRFRNELVRFLLNQKYEVHLLLPIGDYISSLVNEGCLFHETQIERHGTNPISDIKLMCLYKKRLKEIKPDVVLTYTIKPNVYGGMVCSLLHIPYIVNVTGLGTAVQNTGLFQNFVLELYHLGIKNANKIFFQNKENMLFFIGHQIVNNHIQLIPGSGINLSENCFEAYPEKTDRLKVLFVGRIMRDKGINELFEAARQIKSRYDNIVFDVVGPCEDDFENKQELEKLNEQEIIHYWGRQDNIHEMMKNHHVLILPTYHEGMSNVLLEASACGRPVLASNIPGCKETFIEGVSGYGFEPKNVEDLVCKIEKFIQLPYEQKAEMGKAARKHVEDHFDRQIVVDAYMKEIKEIEMRIQQ